MNAIVSKTFWIALVCSCVTLTLFAIESRADEAMEKLKEISKESGVGFLVLRINDQAFVEPIEDLSGVLEFDLNQADLFSVLQKIEQFQNDRIIKSLFVFGGHLVQLGLKERWKGDFSKAYTFYRFPLFFAIHYRDFKNIDIITSNLWILSKEIEKEISVYSQNDEMLKLNQYIRDDCNRLYLKIGDIANKKLQSIETKEQLIELQVLRRLSNLSNDLVTSLDL